MKTFSSDDILNRLKTALSVGTDTELADLLGIKKATLSNWRNRNSIDLPLVFSVCEQVNIDWLITGRGTPALHLDEAPIPTKEVAKDENQFLDRIVAQAEEIGRLKERIEQLEREKNEPTASYQDAPRELSTSPAD